MIKILIFLYYLDISSTQFKFQDTSKLRTTLTLDLKFTVVVIVHSKPLFALCDYLCGLWDNETIVTI